MYFLNSIAGEGPTTPLPGSYAIDTVKRKKLAIRYALAAWSVSRQRSDLCGLGLKYSVASITGVIVLKNTETYPQLV